MKVAVVIPARYASTRFPGKPLVEISGKPMIQHVYESVLKTTLIDEILVATDDNRIKEAVESFQGKVILTDPRHQSGTDRVAEVARNFSSDIFINVQGDEPFISPELIDQIASSLILDQKIQMSSACNEFKSEQEFLSLNHVKVLTDQNLFAIYFSRLPVPFSKEVSLSEIQISGVKNHIGIYGFRRETLIAFSQWKPTPLERQEGLEQLRAIEHGVKIKMVVTLKESTSVDIPQDLDRFRND